jgi:flagellar biogenesis protein FliO
MKLAITAQILLLMLLLSVLTPVCLAQQTAAAGNSNGAEQTNQSNTVTSENDRLPFMKSEQAARAEEPGTGTLLFKTLGAMLLVVGLIFFGAWGLKKFGFGVLKPNAAAQDAPDLAILSTVSLGSGRTISTIQFGERVLLVGSTANAFTLLADETAPERISADQALSSSSSSPRSVADLLDEENDSFEDEFERAVNKFNFPENKGGRI